MKINKDFTSTLINSLWRVVSGPIMLVCIPYFLTPMEQGYWYTFGSLAALSVFADLGFTTIVLQFTAHEFAHLKYGPNRILMGDEGHLWRLASFFRFVIRWLSRIVVIVFPLIVVGGYFFLYAKHDDIHWQIPWIVFSVASAGAFFNSAIMSFFEGCNSVALLQSIRFRNVVVMTFTNFIALFMGFDIYALAISSVVNVAIGAGYILYYFHVPMKQLWNLSREKCYNWWPEFSSLLWRYAISWCSGYFIFQLFTPVAFHFHGAAFSGKIGISIAMWTAGFSIANTFIVAIMPKLNMLVSERKWPELDALFHKATLRAMLVMALGGIAYFIVYYLLHDKFFFFDRILQPVSMFMLFLSWTFQLWVGCIAVYLRAHKKEPLMQISFFSGIWVAVTTLLCAKFLAPEYMFLGFLSQYIYGIPIVYHIYIKQKRAHRMMPAEGDRIS